MSSSSSSTSSNEDFIDFISQLPKLSKKDINTDACPICLLPWDGIEQDVIDVDCELDLGGITKLVGCGHTFCRRDLAQWILGGHGSCPICRHVFLTIVEPPEPETSDDDYTPSSDLEYGADSASDWMDADQEWEDDVDELEHQLGDRNEGANDRPIWPAGGYEDASLEEHFDPESEPIDRVEDDEPFRVDLRCDPEHNEMCRPSDEDERSSYSYSTSSNSPSSGVSDTNSSD